MKKIVRIIHTFDADKFNDVDDEDVATKIAEAIAKVLGNTESYISTSSEVVIAHFDD
jgi:hypothetical protein